MYLIHVNPDNSIEGLYLKGFSQGIPVDVVEISDSDANTLRTHPQGFSVFDYVNGQISINQARSDSNAMHDLKAAKKKALRPIVVALINAVLPTDEEVSESTIVLCREMWLSLAGAAKVPTANMSNIILIMQAWNQARIDIQALPDLALVQAYDVNVDPGWPNL